MNTAANGALPLAKLMVLDFSRFLPAQICTWMLADFGARVIRVENPREIAKLAAAFNLASLSDEQRERAKAAQTLARNKESIVVDLGHRDALDVLRPLLGSADVVVEDYRPGVLARLGFGADALRAFNPRLHYCSVSFAGQTGPYRSRPGHDQLALALSGVLSRIGEDAGRPSFPNVPIADVVTGLNAAIGVLLAHAGELHDARGRDIDVSMLESSMMFASWFLARHPDPAHVPPRGAHRVDCGIWRTRDDRFICTTNIEPRFWERFCLAIGRPDFCARQHASAQWHEMRAEIARVMATRDRHEWLAVFEREDVQAAAVNEFHEALDDPHCRARGMAIPIPLGDANPVVQIGNPVKLSGAAVSVRRCSEAPGASTVPVLENFGFTPEQIAAFAQAGAIGTVRPLHRGE
ncbi:CaiB/BaiF CoA transferase family protein [Paraburkholderia nodosa]|uniref:CaiB/BaiF CoA transferase family protein n=1 Tax=Paraburkholderia nodosa TaxID=392320 RepID=UPI001378E057|nr:CaiB/BaiF CoA-transferase family protein [Paraburkholderia nodosa]